MVLRLQQTRWLFFDIGSVLMDESRTAEEWFLVIEKTLRGQGIIATKEMAASAFQEAIHSYDVSKTYGIIRRLCPDPAQAERLLQEVTSQLVVQDEPYSDARGALEALSQWFHLGIIANQPPGSRDRLIRFGLAPYLQVLALSDELGVAKPDPAIFHYALERAGCSPQEAAMIGDRLDNDIAPANLLGMATIWVKRGPHSIQQPRTPLEKPDLTVDSLEELAHLALAGETEET